MHFPEGATATHKRAKTHEIILFIEELLSHSILRAKARESLDDLESFVETGEYNSLKFVVDIFAISNRNDDNQKFFVFDGVDNGKVAGAHSPEAIASR